jgi:hypothetical protein
MHEKKYGSPDFPAGQKKTGNLSEEMLPEKRRCHCIPGYVLKIKTRKHP